MDTSNRKQRLKAGRELSLCLQLHPQSIMSLSQSKAAFRWHACQGLLLSPCNSCTGLQGANAHDWLTWNETPSQRITCAKEQFFCDLCQFKEQGQAIYSLCSLMYDNATQLSVWFISSSASLNTSRSLFTRTSRVWCTKFITHITGHPMFLINEPVY